MNEPKIGERVRHKGISGNIVKIFPKGVVRVQYDNGDGGDISYDLLTAKFKDLKAGKDFGKYKSPIKEHEMKTLDRIERLMMKEDETQVGTLETPIQSTGSTPEAKDNKDVKPEKAEEKKEEKKEADPNHAEFMKNIKPVMDKVKAKQIVTWQELEQLQQSFDKIKE